MIKRQFDMTVSTWREGVTKDIRVIAENYKSAAELRYVCSSRDKATHDLSDDYFHGANPWKPSWSGFKTSDQLMKTIEEGINRTAVIKEVKGYASKAQVKDEEKLVRKHMDVVGGGVDVPAFLSGEPTCMYGLSKKRVKSRIIKLCIYCKALCYVSVSDYREAGELIAKTVAKLEKAGYRVRLLAMDAYEDRNNAEFYDGMHGIWVVTHMVKKENEAMNYRRILFPLLEMSYHRGLGFGWMCTNGSPYISGLGGSIENVVTDQREREEMFAKACGEDDYIILSQDDVIAQIRRYGQEKAQAMVDAKILSLE